MITFQYGCLGDPKPEIRDLARQFICLYGAKAELALIEGFTKDDNELVRSECVKALAELGIKTIRVTIYGLKDPNQLVRK